MSFEDLQRRTLKIVSRIILLVPVKNYFTVTTLGRLTRIIIRQRLTVLHADRPIIEELGSSRRDDRLSSAKLHRVDECD